MTLKDRLKPAAYLVRRGRGLLDMRGLDVEGRSSVAVVTGLHTALIGRPAPPEAVWIDRIEQTRDELRASTRVFHHPNNTADTIGHMTLSSKPPRWAYLLFQIARAFQPAELVEMGACVGISASYQGAALALNGRPARLVTLDGAEPLAEQSADTIKRLGLDEYASVITGRFQDTLPTVLDERSGRIDWVFVDGHHDGPATLAYLEQILPHLAPEAILAFDDIDYSPDMRAAWQQIKSDKRFHMTLETRVVGFATLSAATQPRLGLRVSYA